ncbi:hypothetical protein [Haliscomenobacter hydrossis]|uniref:Uncharacterized protein n=1 Tax=Haliscomenobacter hydrossis (strain ATCC 27775 / DSM 1100 / LMG 10767 / O) TaxID=760192 RepID=F4L3D0_HALH1|nr:hypothetical protein [Haliscomenobacter hydrossis]AEE51764.1 hypothetical protein Halhy_3915 [Haliscomenobacter hydrossis DSM 1100]
MKIDIIIAYLQRYEFGHEKDFVPPITGIHLVALPTLYNRTIPFLTALNEKSTNHEKELFDRFYVADWAQHTQCPMDT